MEKRNLEKAVEIFAALISGEEVSARIHPELYENYIGSAGVYDLLHTMLKASNLQIYEYQQALYVTAGANNRVFGYSNDELKKTIGLRLNKELFLVYNIIFEIVLMFYKSSSDFAVREYVRAEEVAEAVTSGFGRLSGQKVSQIMSESEAESFAVIAALWEELPMTAANEENASLKAARGSKIGMIKLTFNFLQDQQLFYEAGGKYYALDRFRALIQEYYEDAGSRLYELLIQGGETNAEHSSDPGQ